MNCRAQTPGLPHGKGALRSTAPRWLPTWTRSHWKEYRSYPQSSLHQLSATQPLRPARLQVLPPHLLPPSLPQSTIPTQPLQAVQPALARAQPKPSNRPAQLLPRKPPHRSLQPHPPRAQLQLPTALLPHPARAPCLAAIHTRSSPSSTSSSTPRTSTSTRRMHPARLLLRTGSMQTILGRGLDSRAR